MAKKIFAVMGATGKVGHVVVEELLKKGHQVKAIGRDPKKLESMKNKGVETIACKNFDNEELLMGAFKGSNGVFAMLPPAMDVTNYEAFQDKVGEAVKNALQKSGISHVVNLSSIGADLPEGTGPIKGLYRQEQRLNKLGNLNLVHFRATYFMENLFEAIPGIIHTGALKMPIKGDLGFPMVSTDDIGMKAAQLLDRLDFKGHQVFDFVGPREKPLNLNEVTKILGSAIGKPDLKYATLSYEEAKKGMVSFGLKPAFADLLIEMYRMINEGKFKPTQNITPENRGKITAEEFAKKFAEVFKEAAKQKVAR